MSQKIEQLVEQATLGLEDDPGLRAEVSDELRSHLEQKIAEAEDEGFDNAAAIEAALQGFGTPADIAVSLVEANASRLKLRARVSFVLRRFLVPASIILGIFVGFQELRRFADFGVFFSDVSGKFDNTVIMPFATSPSERISQQLGMHEQNVVFKRAGNLLEQNPEMPVATALWKSDLENPIYYVAHLGALDRARVPYPEDMVAYGDKIDPGNALYRVIAGIDRIEEKDGDEGYRFFRNAAEMPRFERYYSEIDRVRIEILDRPSSFQEQSDHLWLVATMSIPKIPTSDKFVDFLRMRAAKVTDMDDAELMKEFVETWVGFAEHLASDATSLLEGISVREIISKGKTELEEACVSFGLMEELERIVAIENDLRNYIKDFAADLGIRDDENDVILDKTGMIPFALEGFRGIRRDLPTHEEVVPGRAIDYLQIERGAVTGAIVCLLISMGIYGVTAAIRRRKRGLPVVFLLKITDYALILGLGIILPLLFYIVLTRATPLGGHEFSIRWGKPVWALQLGICFVISFQTLAVMTRRCLSRVAEPLGFWERTIYISAGGLMVVASMSVIFPVLWMAAVVISIVVLGVGVGFKIFWWKQILRSAGGELACSIVPVCGFAILIFAVCAIPLLDARERYWVARETLLVPTEAAGGGEGKADTYAEFAQGVAAVFDQD